MLFFYDISVLEVYFKDLFLPDPNTVFQVFRNFHQKKIKIDQFITQ